MDKTSMTLGWLVGKQIAGQRRTQEKQPIAYLYNGEKHPALPEWDKKKYPYAVIGTFTALHKLVLYSAPVKVQTNPFGQIYTSDEVCSTIGYAYTDWEEFEWEYRSDYESTEIPAGEQIQGAGYPEWANFDIYNSDGTLFLSASDPIPVYE